MRIIIDLPGPLFRKLNAIAKQRGTSLKSIVHIAIKEEIRKSGHRVRFPLLDSSEPGSLDLTNAEIENLSA